jgi:hypothetical protein
MNRTSTLVAALALAAAGTAFAQGNPPTTASPNPATAAGQQSPAGARWARRALPPQNNTANGLGNGQHARRHEFGQHEHGQQQRHQCHRSPTAGPCARARRPQLTLAHAAPHREHCRSDPVRRAGRLAAGPRVSRKPPGRRAPPRARGRRGGRQQGRPVRRRRQAQAKVFVFDGDGALRASIARAARPGARRRFRARHRRAKDVRDPTRERTTPAGRFASEPGRNLSGEDIVWVDYDAAVSMHRVRPVVKAERRLERLATPTAADNRITYGCINVPAAFYDAYVKPALGARQGVVYVLPENAASRSIFGFLRN